MKPRPLRTKKVKKKAMFARLQKAQRAKRGSRELAPKDKDASAAKSKVSRAQGEIIIKKDI